MASAAEKKSDALPDGGTVTVGCNVVNGLVLRLYDMEEHEEPVLGGGTRIRKVAVEVGEPVVLRGPRWSAQNQQRGPRAYGYVLNPGISAEFMKRWLKENANTMLVRNECVIVGKNQNEARAEAKDNQGRVSGLEPLIPGTDDKGKPNDARIPRPLKTAIGDVTGIGSDEEHQAALEAEG